MTPQSGFVVGLDIGCAFGQLITFKPPRVSLIMAPNGNNRPRLSSATKLNLVLAQLGLVGLGFSILRPWLHKVAAEGL
ncbi:hypothetical protein LB507_000931 [Fusarium sp. FIESC RH6]|nr:hypothetical protein LB507_000931 [Fusarium sp. FIESC RH6]